MTPPAPEHAKAPRLLVPVLITACVVSVLIGLGLWQIERMGAKQRLIASVTARLGQAPVALPERAQWSMLGAQQDDFLKVSVSGRFLHDKEAYLFMLYAPPNEREPTPGHAVVTPLQTDEGAIVLVNRGFVPESKRDPQSRPLSLTQDRVTVTGLLRLPQSHSWFDASDNPAKRIFYTRDPQAIAAALGLGTVAPFVIEADATPVAGGWPKGGNTVVSFADNHLQYAITWFTLALAVFGLFVIWYRQNRTLAD